MSRSFLTTRTAFLSAIAALVVLLVCVPAIVGQDRNASANESVSGASKDSAATKEDEEDEIKEPPYEPKTKKELQRALSSMQFKVTQNEETEPAFRNKYWDNKKEGVYRCVVCGYSLFSSETKYKSGTGWPSFYAPIKKDHVSYKTDWHLFVPRQEVHCSRCKAHLGHVFDDGPKETTGKRYCMNSASLRFEESTEKKSAPKAKD